MPIYLGSRETSLAFNDWVSHNFSIVLLQGNGLSRAKGVYWKTSITKYIPLYKLCISLSFFPLYPKECCLDSQTFLSYCTYKEKVTLTLFSCNLANSLASVWDGVFRNHPEPGNLPKAVLAFLTVSTKQQNLPPNWVVTSSLFLQKSIKHSDPLTRH